MIYIQKNDKAQIKWTLDLTNYYSKLVKIYICSNMLIKW
jgi:hypothetical protein